MKKLITILFLLICLSAGATDVLFTLSDFGASPQSNRNVSVQMVSPFPGNVKQYFAGADGTLTITNMGVAVYQCYIKAPPSQIPFMIQVLSTNLGTVSASSITVASGTATFPAGTVAWSTLASDQRYFQGTNIDASGLQHGNQNITNWGNVSTNAYLTTNAASGFQPFSTNLTDWSHLPTNVVQTGGGSGTGIQTNNGTGNRNTFYSPTLVFTNYVGGTNNSLSGTTPLWNIISGGQGNTMSSVDAATISGGQNNSMATEDFGVIAGGYNNRVIGSLGDAIAGGFYNSISNSSGNNFIGGGSGNFIAPGAEYSFAMGLSNYISQQGSAALGSYARATNLGTFVWSDSSSVSSFQSTSNNQFLIRATGGVGINTNTPSGGLSVNGIISSTNYEIIGNTLFTRNTNSISIVGAGSSAANGTFDLNGGQYTNWLTGSVISNNTSIWVLKNSSGTVLYSLATATPLSSGWTVVGGSGPAPASFFGAVVNESGQVHYGPLTSTNMTWQMTNWINQLTIAPTNSGSSGQVLGLTGADVAWVAQSGGGGGGSNSVSQGNNLVTVATNTGNFAISGVSQTNGQTTLIYTNPSMVLMTNIWIPSSNSLYASIASQIQTATNSSVSAITNTFTYTNDTRSLYLSNVNSKYYGTAKLSAISTGPIKILANNLSDIAETNFWELKENADTSLQFSQATNQIFSAPVGFLKTNGWADASGNVVLFSRQTNLLVYTNDGRALIHTNQGNIFSAQTYQVNGNPTFRSWTNTIAIYGSFETTNNTTYTWNGSVYTNTTTGSYVAYNGSGWNIITRGGTLQYAISGSSPVNGTWTANTGPLPAPTNSSFGYLADFKGGQITNIDSIAASSFIGGGSRLTDVMFTNPPTGNVVAMTPNGALIASGQPIISTNTFQFLEQYPVQTNATLAVNAGLDIHGDYTYYSTGNYWYHPTNADPTSAIATIYQTNFVSGQVVWVMTGGGFPAYWKTNANLYGPEPWYPDPSFWSGLLSMNVTNVVRVSALTPIEAMVSSEAKMAQRFHESTRVPAFMGGLPIAELENFPASGVILTNAVTFLTNSLLQGIIDVVEMDRWSYKRNSNGDQIFDTATFGSLTLSGYSTYLHDNGFKAALHMDYGTWDITGGAGSGFASSTASYPYYHQDATNLVSNGIDMMLMDTTALPPVSPSEAQDYAVQFIHELRAAQATYNRPFFVEGAFNGSFPGHFEDWMPIADGWTTAEDIGTDAEFLKALKTTTGYRGFGKYPFLANPDDTTFTASAVTARKLGNYVAIGPTHIQFHTTNNLTASTVGVWTNSEWRAIWRDTAGNPGYQISSNATGEVWARQMGNGDTVVAMINLTGSSGTLSVSWNDLKIAPSNTVMVCRDIYRFTNVVVASQLSVAVVANEGTMWRLTPAAKAGQLSGNGSPEGSVTAPVGWTYKALDGTGTLYVKTNGVNSTGWYDLILRTHG